jgi:hypothetical protein
MQISAYSGAVAAVARPELNSQEKHLAVLVCCDAGDTVKPGSNLAMVE